MKIQNSPSNPTISSPYSSTTTYTSPSLTSSSIDSSSSSPSSSPRCAGLDLLVKAIYQVNAGSIIGVPYIQKRVITRRSRRSQNLIFDHTMFLNFDCKAKIHANGTKKKQRRMKKTIQDSVFETCRTKSRYGRDLSKMVMKL